MVRNNSYFVAALLLVASSFVSGIQGGLFNPGPASADNPTGNIGAILKRLDHLELKEHRLDQLELEVDQLKKDNVELKVEVGQLKKKNVELENKLESILTTPSVDNVGYQVRKQNSAVISANGRDFLPRSCYELKATNPSAQSGFYFIDPDGQINGDDPVQAHCDMDTRTTSILHDTEDKTSVASCSDPGCYTKQIKYNATLRQMVMLADISGSCQQYFRFDSLSVPLEYNVTQYGFWNDRNGAKQIFWAGPANSKHTCQCGLENPNRCVEQQYNCNSDSLAPIELYDEGYITATELLPVTRLSFGRTSLTGVKASYTLGRFQCTGQAPISSKPENCRTLFQMGHTVSGFYLVKSGSSKVAATYCDFSKDSAEAGYETRIGNVDVISSPVQFYVQRNAIWSTINTPMTFQVTRLNVGNAMNIGTGVFKAPKAGTYSFAFSGLKVSDGLQSWLELRLNGGKIGYDFFDAAGSYMTSSSLNANLKLKVGDEITLVLIAGSLFDNADYYTHFTGILIEEDLIIS